jgi:hypothetical protein
LGILFLCSLDEDRILPERPSRCHAFFLFFPPGNSQQPAKVSVRKTASGRSTAILAVGQAGILPAVAETPGKWGFATDLSHQTKFNGLPRRNHRFFYVSSAFHQLPVFSQMQRSTYEPLLERAEEIRRVFSELKSRFG